MQQTSRINAFHWHSRGPVRAAIDGSPVLSGLLLALAFPPFDYAWLAWWALLPLALAMARPSCSQTTWGAVYVAALLAHLPFLYWLTTCTERLVSSAALWSLWLGSGALGGGLVTLTFAVGRRLLAKRRWPVCLVLPVVWTTWEFARHHIGMLIDTVGFPWLKLGNAVSAQLIWLQSADLTGELGLTFLAALFSGWCVDVVNRWRQRPDSSGGYRVLGGAVVAAPLALGFLLLYGCWRLAQPAAANGPSVCLMSEVELPPLVDRERIATSHTNYLLEDDSELPANDGMRMPDLLVWPEAAYHHTVVTADSPNVSVAASSRGGAAVRLVSRSTNPEVDGLALLQETARDLTTAIVMGCHRHDAATPAAPPYRSLAVVDSEGKYVGAADKRYLVPWVEFVPATWVPVTSPEQVFRRGRKAPLFSIRGGSPQRAFRFGCAVCYDACFEIPSPGARPDFYVHCGTEPVQVGPMMHAAMLRMARLRAVEARRAVVRNATHGASGMIDGCGQLVATAPSEFDRPVALGSVPLDDRVSLYACGGDWLPWLCMAVLVGGCLRAPRACPADLPVELVPEPARLANDAA
mgnify:CR=1 FL=1